MGVETLQYLTTTEPGPPTSGRLPKATNGSDLRIIRATHTRPAWNAVASRCSFVALSGLRRPVACRRRSWFLMPMRREETPRRAGTRFCRGWVLERLYALMILSA